MVGSNGGKFTKNEVKFAEKIPPNQNVHGLNCLVPRTNGAGDCDGKSCGLTVVMDEDENIILIHFQNILDNYIMEQRQNISNKFKSELNEG